MFLDDYQLHGRLETLAAAATDRDVLVSVVAPPDGTIGDVREPIETEYAEATTLAEKAASQHLLEALEELRRRLKSYDELPENGLAAYAGVVDGELVVEVFDDLPTPVETDVYEHANEFVLDPLESVTEPSAVHGLLVVERGGAALGRLDDEGVEVLRAFESDVPGKSSAGGQSAERFERDRERQKREFFETVAERAARAFLEDEPVDGVLLGGTTGTIEAFREEADLDHRLADRLLEETFAVEYASEQGLRQLAERGGSALEERERGEAREACRRFFEGLGDDETPVAHGEADVDDALEYEAVETLLLSTAVSGRDVQALGDRAKAQGGECVIVPDDFPDGTRFADAFGGVGALLRFPIE